MILHVTPKSAERREFLKRVQKWTELGNISIAKSELVEIAADIPPAALAMDASRERIGAMLDSLSSAFSALPDDNPLSISIQRTAEQLASLPGWDGLRDVDAEPDSSTSFPFDAFPAIFGEYIHNATEYVQTDAVGVGAAVLAIAAGAAQHRFCVAHPSGNGHKEALCLYICIVGNSAARKSGSFDAVKPLIERWTGERTASYGTALADYRAEHQAVEARKQSALATLKSPKDPGDSAREAAENKLKIAERELEAMKRPPDPDFVTGGNSTLEPIVDRLQETGGTLLMLDSEAHFLDIMRGSYNREGATANIDPLLDAYDGHKIIVTRSGRRVVIPAAHISVCLYSQPAIFARFFSDYELAGRGMVPRFLPARMKYRHVYEDYCAPLDENLRDRCAERLAEILDVPLTDDPQAIGWQEDARAEILRYTQTLQDARLPGGSMSAEDDSSFAGKQPGACYRIAAILHLLAEGVEAADGISAETARRAITLHRYFWSTRNTTKAEAARSTREEYAETLEALLHLTFDAPTIRGSCTLSELWRECRDHHAAIFGKDQAARTHFYDETIPELADLGYIYAAPRAKGKTVDVYLSPSCLTLE